MKRHIDLLTTTDLKVSFAERLKEQYFNKQTEKWRNTNTHTSEQMEQLYAQSSKFTVSTPSYEVEQVLQGFLPWLHMHCDVCGKAKDKLIYLGEYIEYEQPTVGVCKKCLKKSIRVIDKDDFHILKSNSE